MGSDRKTGRVADHRIRDLKRLCNRQNVHAAMRRATSGVRERPDQRAGEETPSATRRFIDGLVDVRAKVEIEDTAVVPAASKSAGK
jgi:hypothetical protein